MCVASVTRIWTFFVPLEKILENLGREWKSQALFPCCQKANRTEHRYAASPFLPAVNHCKSVLSLRITWSRCQSTSEAHDTQQKQPQRTWLDSLTRAADFQPGWLIFPDFCCWQASKTKAFFQRRGEKARRSSSVTNIPAQSSQGEHRAVDIYVQSNLDACHIHPADCPCA